MNMNKSGNKSNNNKPGKKASKQKQDQALKGTADEQVPVRGVRYEGQFFKTKLCMFWEKGQCTRGADCKYAHGGKEMNEMPNLTNTSLCKELLATGACTRPNCLFAHQIEDLRATKKFFKTSMCSFFRVGQCRLGKDCRHAHDASELQPVPDQEASNALSRASCNRRGGSIRKQLTKFDQETEEDDLGDLVSWERTTTSPPTFGATFGATWPCNAPMPYFVTGPAQPMSQLQPRFSSMQQPASTSEEEEDEDPDFDADFECNMWERMRTMPAVGQCVVVNSGGKDQNQNQGIPLVGTMINVSASQSTLASSSQPWSRQNSSATKPRESECGYSAATGEFKQPVVMVPYVLVPVPCPSGSRLGSAKSGGMDQMPMAQNPYAQMRAGATQEMCNQMEAQLLESAMPEVYED